MIKVEKLSYSFSEKDLYNEVSFEIEEGQHAVLIGSNGTGKTTLVHLLMNPDEFLYDGKITRDINGRMGYVSQFEKAEKERDITVFEFLSEDFKTLQDEMEAVCKEMETAEEFDELMERYQQIMDESQAVDADNYESNIRKQLSVAGLSNLETLPIRAISGGEYKLLQVVKQILRKPSLLIMDEPDVFLDFDNLKGLRDLCNSYQGTLLAITHNRYLLNHCFNKILHLENGDIQEFDGTFVEYNFALLAQKVELQEQVAKEQEEIDRNQKIVDKLRANATRVASASRGKALHARVSYLERLEARRVKAPFVELRQPQIVLPEIDCKLEVDDDKLKEASAELQGSDIGFQEPAKDVLCVDRYTVAFDELLLENISFTLKENEKVAIVGPNGTGKTTLLRDIFKHEKSSIAIADDTEMGFLSQIHGEMLDEKNTVYEEMESIGEDNSLSRGTVFNNRAEIAEYLNGYCFETDMLQNKVEVLSGGEKSLLQLAKIGRGTANLLLLDEPTSHLDTYAQVALEKAIANYKGAVLMVSHDFYTIANCVDYVLFVENKTIRKMRIRSFRKMIYENHFNKDYLELEQKKKELEQRVEGFLQEQDFESAKVVCEQLEAHIMKMKQI